MNREEIVNLIGLEFKTKTFAITEQYLEIHEAVYTNDLLKIDRIDRESGQDLIIAYLPVKDEYFYFAVYIDPNKKEILNISTESRNLVSLRATSETLSSQELQSFTKLKATRIWDKGDIKPNGKSVYNFNCIEFTPNPEPDAFEDKLEKLLLFLKTDSAGIVNLTKNSDAYIQIIMDFHAGNQLLGSAFVDLENIKKLHDLNLSISFDITAWGHKFK